MEHAGHRSAAANASKIVMGVDDAKENLLILKAIIQSAGFTFISAVGGHEAIALIRRAVPRLILLDVEMPGIDGFETCRRLRSDPALERTPIAFLTARKTAADVQAGIAAGGNDFIIKPFDREQLIERVRFWAARRAPIRLAAVAATG